MTATFATNLVQFIRSIAVLALPAEDQVQWLNSLGLPGKAAIVDEMAQEFGNGFLLLPQFVEQGWIPNATVKMLNELDSLLADMSGPEHENLWDISALEHAEEWAKVRRQATRILFAL